jgi:tripartite motif-containing protein 71
MMPFDRARTAPRLLRSARLALLATLALALCAAGAIGAARARAETCPGAGAGACPYASAQSIGQRAEGVLRFPEAVAVDTQGDVYVADQLSYVVEKFSDTGAFVGEWGTYGGGHGQFGPIGGLATDAAGNVYVVDSSHDRIEKFDPNGNFLTQWGHKGSEPGEFNFGSSQDYTKPPGGGIAVFGGYVYVADSGNNRIERFNLEGGETIEWGTKGDGPGQFSYPRGIAANAGEVLVADDDNHRIEKFDPSGAYESASGSQGTGAGQFGFPYGVALDAVGNAYVADDLNHRVVKLNPELGFLGTWGGYGTKPGQLAFPRAIASDPAGDTYVANTANDRIEVFNPEGRFLRTIGISARGPGVLTGPRGLATDPADGLLVSDTVDNRVELFAPLSDAYVSQWSVAGGHTTGFSKPAGIGVDPRGSVYVTDEGSERIVHMWGDGTYLSEIGGPAQLGGAQLNGADAVAVSPQSGRTYVADAGHNRVLVYGPEGTLQAKWGAGGGDGSASSQPGGFNHPSGVAVSGVAHGEDVYVADKGNDRIVELSPGGEVLTMWGARGTADSHFHAPSGVAVDGAGDVYALDTENNRVQVFDGGGRFLTKWGVRGPGLGGFSQPSAIAVDCAGNVYVADTNNNRVERFNPVSPQGIGCIEPAAWPPPLDVAPVLHIGLPRSTGVLARRALALSVSCERGCKILVTATLAASSGHRRKPIALVAVARSLPRAKAGHVRLRVGPRGLQRLQRALGRGKGMLARVRIVAAGPTGRRTTVNRIYSVRR